MPVAAAVPHLHRNPDPPTPEVFFVGARGADIQLAALDDSNPAGELLGPPDIHIHHQGTMIAVSEPFIYEAELHRPHTAKPCAGDETVIDVMRHLPTLLLVVRRPRLLSMRLVKVVMIGARETPFRKRSN